MDDRVSRYPGRVKLTPVEGQENVYDMVLADEPITTGTRLNKANLLSDQVATLIGLTASAVPDDMFNVLATAGDLHVWRRTVETSDKIPAKYTLGSATSLTIATTTDKRYTVTSYYSSEISVSDNGEVIAPTGSKANIGMDGRNLTFVNANLTNCFIRYEGTREDGGLTVVQGVYFIPGDAAYSVSGNTLRVSKSQKVTGVPAVPPGTNIDYPVSTNSKSYQEGTGPKPAGYNVGIIVDSKMKFIGYSYDGLSSANCFYAKKLSVTEYGEISLTDKIQYNEISDSGATQANQNLKGSYFYVENNSGGDTSFSRGVIYYIPSNATFSYESSSKALYVNRYQPVTGYPAIPAGTTIEYLGKLGGASHLYSGGYSGNSTSALSPRTINLGFRPKAVLVYSRTTDGFESGGRLTGGLAVDGFPTYAESIKVVSNGFSIQNISKSDGPNFRGLDYSYLAWR